MARQTIIDWQRDSLVVAVGQGTPWRIDQLSEQPIGQIPEGSDALIPLNGDAAQALVRGLDAVGGRKSDATVVLSRELVEVRTLAIPRIDPDELPDVIRFQAQRQLANMGDSWTLDYVLLPDVPGQEMMTALVAAISPQTMQEIATACEQAGVQLAHVTLRPLEIARFALSTGKLVKGEPGVVVCLSAGHADLMLLCQDQVVLVRSTNLSGDSSAIASTLNGELRRSLMAASPQLAGRPLKSALLIADSVLAEAASDVMAAALNCPVTTFEPNSLLSSGSKSNSIGDQSGALPQPAVGRLAGIVGVSQLSSSGRQTKIDFKDPHKRPPPKSKRTTYILAAAATTLVVISGASWWAGIHRGLDDELAAYRSQIVSKKDMVEAAQGRITQVQEIDRFLQSSTNWLDEMTYIAEHIPASDKVLLGEPAFATLPDGSGRIAMPVAVDSSSTIGTFESSLRDDQHVVTGKNSTQLGEAASQLYRWRVDEAIVVTGRGWPLVSQLETGRRAETSETKAKEAE